MRLTHALALLAATMVAAPAAAGFIIDIDLDGDNSNGAVVDSPNFMLGPDMTITSITNFGQNSAPGLAGGNPRFGGDAPSGGPTPTPDRYIYTYTPGVDGDNDDATVIGPGGVALNDDGQFSSGLQSGGAGLYNVYAAWTRNSGNISNVPTNYVLNDGTSDILSNSFDQNDDELEGDWVLVGTVMLDPSKTYTLTQSNTPAFVAGVPGFSDDAYNNGFVSMYASGVLFDKVPEPASAALVVLGLTALCMRRK